MIDSQFVIERIKMLQKKRKLTAKALGEELGLNPQNVYDLFAGKTTLKIEHLNMLSKVFRVPISYFFDESDGNNFFNNQVAIGDGMNSVQGSGSMKNIYQNKDINQETELELLKRENDALRREIELLKDLIDSKDRMIDILTNKKA